MMYGNINLHYAIKWFLSAVYIEHSIYFLWHRSSGAKIVYECLAVTDLGFVVLSDYFLT